MTGFTNQRIPNDFRGTARTIAAMHAVVKAAVAGIGPDGKPNDDRIVRLARDIVQSVPAKDYLAECAAILRWVQANVRYVRDPWTPDGGVDRIQHPAVTIWESHAEDCDGLAVVFSSLAAAVGTPWAFRTVGVDPLDPGAFVHVYPLAIVNGMAIPADASFPDAPLGWEPPDDDPRIQVGQVRRGAQAAFRRDWPAERDGRA